MKLPRIALFGLLAVPFLGTLLPTLGRADSAGEIKAIQLSIAADAEKRDLDGITSHYIKGDKLFVFDAYPPRQYVGWDAFRGDWKDFTQLEKPRSH